MGRSRGDDDAPAARPVHCRLRLWICLLGSRRVAGHVWAWRRAIVGAVLCAAVLAACVFAARSRVRARLVGFAYPSGGEAEFGLAALQSAARSEAFSVDDRTATGTGVTAKYLVSFAGGERALFKPLRSSFTRIGVTKAKGGKHFEEPLGELVGYHLALAMGVRGVPPATVASLPAAAVAAATRPASVPELLSRCPRYVGAAALRAAYRGTNESFTELRGDCALAGTARVVTGVLVRWEPAGLLRLTAVERFALAAAVRLCSTHGLCPTLGKRDREGWADLEAFDAVLGNYDRKNNVFLRGDAIVPLDHNHLSSNLNLTRPSWTWCTDHSARVLRFLRAVLGKGDAAAGVWAALFASLRAAEKTTEPGYPSIARFRYVDRHARAYARHVLVDCPKKRRRRTWGRHSLREQ